MLVTVCLSHMPTACLSKQMLQPVLCGMWWDTGLSYILFDRTGLWVLQQLCCPRNLLMKSAWNCGLMQTLSLVRGAYLVFRRTPRGSGVLAWGPEASKLKLRSTAQFSFSLHVPSLFPPTLFQSESYRHVNNWIFVLEIWFKCCWHLHYTFFHHSLLYIFLPSLPLPSLHPFQN